MDIFITLADDNRQEVVTLDATDTIQDLKRKASEAFDFSPGSFELFFSGDKVEDLTGLSSGDELYLEYSKCFFAIKQLQERNITPPYSLAETIRAGDHKVIELMLDTGIEITLAMVAIAVSMSQRSLKILLERLDSGTAGQYATKMIPVATSEAMVLELLAFGADPHVTHRRLGSNGLHHSCKLEDDCVNLVQYLVDKYTMDVTLPDSHGVTCLHFAASIGNSAVARFLLERGADPCAQSNVGLQPLHFAASRGKMRCLVLLLEKGAKVNCTNNAGNTPLYFAVRNGSRLVVEHLSTVGANPNTRNELGITPYTEASKPYRNVMIDLFGGEFPPEPESDSDAESSGRVKKCWTCAIM